ncbi:MAG: ABC transporter ATP-binding protein [Chitinophagaceae bacterium]|nr:ABC transporter ATP-binding protein [Chitinophagaceae bacterium]
MSNTNYNLNAIAGQQPKKTSNWKALGKLINLLPEKRNVLIWALIAILAYSGLTMVGPYIIGRTIDKYIRNSQNFNGILRNCGFLLLIYGGVLVCVYLRTTLMGSFGQHLLFKLRNTLFNKLQELPNAFFAQNKAGDLISRVNSDTDKINQFFSQSLMQFVSSIFIIIGAGIALLVLNFRLGLATLSPALLMWIFTKLVTPWVKRKNAANLKSVGGLSAEIQESLDNFKVIIAFNRRDYFRKRFDKANKGQYSSAIKAGLANNIFMPVYSLASSLGQLIMLTYGIYLITSGNFTTGFLISFFAYVTSFYDPLRQMAALWASFQVALAAWDRVSQILNLESDLATVAPEAVLSVAGAAPALLEFQHVSFHYPDGTEVLHNNSFRMEKGKTYALVGPTGGGKTTTASLIARLYDPTAGKVLLDGRDLRSYTAAERTRKIGFILQEPFLFSGTVRDNILYGNEQYHDLSNEELAAVIEKANLQTLLSRFDAGLDTTVASGDGISLGQRQLIAFMRAVLRNPELLILDEATANIDTITEKMLEDILQKLPDTTTRVIIAHRLNTIENADEIFFVNGGAITRAGSLDQAVDMLLHGKRVS